MAKKKSSKPNLFSNIRAKRARGEKPAKPGDEDYPDEETWERETKESIEKIASMLTDDPDIFI